VLARRDIVSCPDPFIPPDALSFRPVFREYDFKAAFTVVPCLLSRASPAAIVMLCGADLSSLPRVRAIAVRIQRRTVLLIIFDLRDGPVATCGGPLCVLR
jgi:hypothetical protein